MRWNAQHGSLRRPSDTAFHPAIVSGVLSGGTSSCGMQAMSCRWRSTGEVLRRLLDARGHGTQLTICRGDGFVEAGGCLGIERSGDCL